MAASISTNDTFLRFKRSLQSTLGLILKVTTFLVIAVFGGLISSWYFINHGVAFNTERVGPWVKWTMGGRLQSDPYSLIRLNRNEMLVFASTFVSRYEASFDDDKRRLHSACHYALSGRLPDSPWWSLNVYDSAGRLIPNASNRHGFNAATVVAAPDGAFRIDLAREARPGNWIPTSRAGRLSIVLEIQNLTGDTGVPADAETLSLPTIERIGCR